IATALARLLQTALRALRNTSADPSSLQSTLMASKRSRVSLRRAFSESAHSSTSISRSLKVRRSTRTIFSSEQSSNDFKLIALSLTFDRCTQAFEKGGGSYCTLKPGTPVGNWCVCTTGYDGHHSLHKRNRHVRSHPNDTGVSISFVYISLHSRINTREEDCH